MDEIQIQAGDWVIEIGGGGQVGKVFSILEHDHHTAPGYCLVDWNAGGWSFLHPMDIELVEKETDK